MYRAINDALNGVFLGGRFESRPLYLVLDKRARAELVQLLAGEVEDTDDVEETCCRAVGAYLSKTGDPYAEVLFEAATWRANGRRTLPPFTGVLYTLARAAELMVSDGNFSQNNYYQRLAEITGISASRLSLHGTTTEKLWRFFNNWLADTDLQYGLPTGRPVNSWRYVGIAMSQAIVREEDRQRFHDMFERYGFRPGEAISENEIGQYIGTWIHSGKPTRQLKLGWEKAELRPRICEAAVAELREWSEEAGATPGGGARGRTRMSLAASFKQDHFSRTRSIVTWLGREAEIESLDLAASGGAALTLGNSTFGSFATVEPRAAIDWVKAFTHGLQLETDKGDALSWSGRPVIPLSRSERGAYWNEVSRLALGSEHVVLVRDEPRIRKSVEAALEQVAIRGYTLSTAKELKGLPAGWVAYEGVHVVAALDEPSDLQLAWSPVGDTGGLQVLGGLKIGQSIWHESRPPSVLLEARGKTAVLSAWPGTSAEADEACRVESSDGQAFLEVAKSASETGNVYVQGLVDGVSVGSVTLLLRSAARPRPLDRMLRGYNGYSGPWTAVPLVQAAEVTRGLVASPVGGGQPAHLPSGFDALGKASGEEEDTTGLAAAPSESSSSAISLSGLSLAEVMALPCSARGIHVYKYETLPPGYPKYAPVNKQCKDCDLHVLERRRGKSTKAKTPPAPRTVRPFPATTMPALADATASLPMDLWLDTASFSGRGSLAAFEALVAADGLDPWRTSQVLRDLSWLGHLDLDHGKDMRPRGWSVAPPTLAFTSTGRGFLAGFRNAALLDEVEQRVQGAGATFTRTSLAGQPELVEVEGLRASHAREVLADVRDYHGRQLAVIDGAASDLARFCVARGDLQSAYTPMTLSSIARVERFDPSRSRWRSAESAARPGAYRFVHAGTQYAFRSASGQAYLTSHEMAKLGAARLEGIHLHAYDENSKVFSSVLGCEPPALLGRALVASSGRLPTVQSGTSLFQNVPPDVAADVLSLLYTGDLPS